MGATPTRAPGQPRCRPCRTCRIVAWISSTSRHRSLRWGEHGTACSHPAGPPARPPAGPPARNALQYVDDVVLPRQADRRPPRRAPYRLLSQRPPLVDHSTPAFCGYVQIAASRNRSDGFLTIACFDAFLFLFLEISVLAQRLPWRHRTVPRAEGSVRKNNVDELAAFLKREHRQHYLIINLAPFDKHAQYDYDKLDQQIVEFPICGVTPPTRTSSIACDRARPWLQCPC